MLRLQSGDMFTSFTKIGYTAALLSVIAFCLYSLRGPQGIPAWLEKRKEVVVRQEENARLYRENEALRLRIERLEKDANQQEWEIRKRLKLVHPEETVYILQDSAAADPPATK